MRLNLFYDWQHHEQALQTCYHCPVRSQCLRFHQNERYGIFGGTTPAERGYRDGRHTNDPRTIP
ncbi:WhiB family transcriptional regulator [Streptomyces sp. NPDC057686]|uniref:WhiB family transcriptional regulator n=1 Tax=Streptomyces sp. NPDC057686 TaxID=3346212 RepID=UPI0036763D79